MHRQNYLITGVAGFIGSHVAERLLEQDVCVIGVDNFCDFYNPAIKKQNIQSLEKSENFILEQVDIRDKKQLQQIFYKYQPTVVIHLAAMAGVRPSIAQPQLYNDVNIAGTLNVLEAMKQFGVDKLVFASSSSVYGNNKKVPFAEVDNVDKAISPYAATKKSCEILAHTYHHLYKMDMILLRFFTVYGERQRPDLAIHKFTKMIFAETPIPFYGDGTTRRDYTYIKDIVDGVEKSIRYVKENNSVYEILNLGESKTISLKEMVETISEVVGKKAIINQLPMQPGDVKQTYADISKAQKMIGYAPTMDFRKGIERFVAWYKKENNI